MARVYRNISVPLRIAGLDIYDLLFLVVLFLIVFNVSDHLFLNVGVLLLLTVFIRMFKKGKPEGYLRDLARFLLSPSERHVLLERKKERRKSESR